MLEQVNNVENIQVPPPVRPPIKLLRARLPVQQLHAELLAHPELWNQHKARTEQYAHSAISDIWLRYNDLANFKGDLESFNAEHESVWYPSFDLLPASVPIIFNTMRFVMGERLGGVLITKVPPGGRVEPHSDHGWHATKYQKFAVQIAATDEQAFCFDEMQLITAPGDMYTFDNQKLHWVENDSDEDRITMIICIESSLDWLEDPEGE
jgi:quercetin dioxygenase-like cupin family protein